MEAGEDSGVVEKNGGDELIVEVVIEEYVGEVEDEVLDEVEGICLALAR